MLLPSRRAVFTLAASFGALVCLSNHAFGASPPESGEPASAASFIVVIDPAHGGRDSGSRGASLVEKDFTLRAGRAVVALLSRHPEVKASLTRETDAQMSRARRAAVANYGGASLFLSLHADASWRPGARGPLIITAAPRRPPRVRGEAPGAVALRWQRSQNVHLASSRRFALGLQKRFAAVGLKVKPPLRVLPARDLEGARMPAAYVSLGVISTPEEEARLREMGEEDAYLAAVVEEIFAFAGLGPPPAEPPAADPPAAPEGDEAAPDAREREAAGESEEEGRR